MIRFIIALQRKDKTKDKRKDKTKEHLTTEWVQGRIQSKFEGGAVFSGGAERFSEIGDECSLYTKISDPNY